MKNAQNNEVDLFNLMETLWISRRLIGIFVFIALLFAGGILSLKNPVYISMISMSIDTSPAGYTRASEVMVDFEKMFYSKKMASMGLVRVICNFILIVGSSKNRC